MGLGSQHVRAGTGQKPGAGPREAGIVLLAAYHFLMGGLFLLASVGLSLPTVLLGLVAFTQDPEAAIGMFVTGLLAAVSLAFCLLYLAIGYGLWTLRQWARVAATALAILSLFAVPVGTVLGGLTIWYLQRAEVADRFR